MFYAHHLISRWNRNALVRNAERRLSRTVDKTRFKKNSARFLRETRALAIPVTYLILFTSLITIIAATYSFAVIKIAAKGASLRASIAKQNMQTLDAAVHTVAWTSGASEIVYIDGFEGVFKVEPTARDLIINLTDGHAIDDIVFKSPIGKVLSKLESSEASYSGQYTKGDERAITNQTAFTMTQLYGEASTSGQNIVLCYRPMAISTAIGTSNGKPLNLIRIYIINLNTSKNLSFRDSYYLKTTALNVSTVTRQYEFNQPISSLELNAVLDGTLGSVQLPVSSNDEGAKVNLETVICNIRLENVEV